MNLDDAQYNLSKDHLFPFLVFNVIQWRQICLKVKLTMSKSSNMNEREFLNKIQSIDFNEIIKNPWNINGNININNILHHIKISNKYVMAFGVSHNIKRSNIQYNKFHGNKFFFFYFKILHLSIVF